MTGVQTCALPISLGLQAIAEGVESDEQLASVRDLGCDLAQGYHLSKPLMAADVVTWIRSVSRVRATQEPAEIRRVS